MSLSRRSLLALPVIAGLVGCGVTLAPDTEAAELADKAYSDLAAGNFDVLMAAMPEEIRNPTSLRTLSVMQAMLPPGQAQPGVLVGWNNSIYNGVNTATVTHRYDYPADGEHILAVASFLKGKDGHWKMQSLNVRGASSTELGGPSFGTRATAPPPVAPRAPSAPRPPANPSV